MSSELLFGRLERECGEGMRHCAPGVNWKWRTWIYMLMWSSGRCEGACRVGVPDACDSIDACGLGTVIF